MPGEQELPPYEVLAALVASLRRELAEMAGVLAKARTRMLVPEWAIRSCPTRC
jgi:hypothetical protein